MIVGLDCMFERDKAAVQGLFTHSHIAKFRAL